MNDIERRDFWERELNEYVERLKREKQEALKIENEKIILNLNETHEKISK